MKKLLTAFLAAVCLWVTGCASSESSVISDNEMSSASVMPESTDNIQLAQQLSNSFMDYWEALDDHTMLGKTVEVFTSDLFEDYGKTVFFVYPEYNTCRALIFGVNGGEVELTGDISCGFEFAMSEANGGTLRATKTYYMSHSSEMFDTYYKISSVGTEETLCISMLFFEDAITGYERYINGEASELDEEEYNSVKAATDSDFNNAVFVDLDADRDLRLDSGYEISDREGLAEYILGKLNF